jgi:hypothetical protein
MESIDITSSGLREHGYSLKKEDSTLVLHSDSNGVYPHRFTIYKNDWNKTTSKIEKKLEELGFQQIIISAVLKDMSDNYPKLVNGAAAIKKQQQQQQQEHQQIPKMASKAIKAGCPMEVWSTTQKQKYESLKKLVDKKAPGLWMPLEFVLTLKCILNIKDITLPVMGLILGPPGSWKSQAVNMPKHARDTFGLDKFNPKSFVSHNSNLTEEQLQENDLLPKIQNKLFMVPELSPLFTSREEDLEEIIGMIVRLGDGEGYASASGAKGVRGYEGPIMFVWVGAAVDIPYKIHTMLSRLGPKLYFFRLPMQVSDEDALLKALQDNDFRERMREVKKAVFDYIEYLESCPEMETDPASGIPKFNWDTKNSTQEDAQRYIIKLAELLAYLRGTVSTWETKDTQGLEYAYTSRIIENPERTAIQLHNLARAHALSQGRQHITMKDDLPFIIKVVLSGAASIERIKVLELMIKNKDKNKKYTADEIAETIKTSPKTAKRVMAEFTSLGMVELEELGNVGEPLVTIRLSENLSWVFDKQFDELRGDYTPGDFKKFLVDKGKKEKEKTG